MTDQKGIEQKFWKALRADRTVMLGLSGAEDAHSHPMTALVDGDDNRGPLWIFTSSETDLARSLTAQSPAMMQFVSKGHDVFACIDGALTPDNDRAVIDRLWNPFVAAWYSGKDDPKLLLLRFDPNSAQIWLNESSLLAGAKMLFGRDPKKEFADKVAEVRLS